MKGLPGWSVPGCNPRLQRNGYSLREDADCAFVIFGSDEIVAAIPAKDATVDLIERVIRDEIVEKLWAAVPLNAKLPPDEHHAT